MPLASKGDLLDSTAGGELVWFAVAKGKIKVADAPFRAAGGTTSTGTRSRSSAATSSSRSARRATRTRS